MEATSSRMQGDLATPSSVNDSEDREIMPMMSISGGPWGLVHQPIHESLTLSALVSCGYDVAQGTTLSNASTQDWEYLRGAVWNDDPQGLLFKDTADNNHRYWTGYDWFSRYRDGAKEWQDGRPQDNALRNPTGRSHYGDLQFLHCMACHSGEAPQETKRKMMVWLEVMYKLANEEDDMTGGTLIENTKLIEFCPVLSLPPSFKSLHYLLSADTKFQGVDVKRRALGSIFHIIQDSYAIGHTRRTPLNPLDKQSDDPLKFKPGTYDRWGPIENFHTYGGQDTNAHSHFDHSNDAIPNPGNLGDVSQFDGLVGCRMAVEKCKELIALKRAGKGWDDDHGVRKYLDEDVFALATQVSPANNQVWG
ncbi:hypothetical protein KCU98_g2812, partial [Aureobasidium melanogenum]